MAEGNGLTCIVDPALPVGYSQPCSFAVVVPDRSPVALPTPEVCAITGVSYRQIDYWVRSKLITPSAASGEGSGHYRKFTPSDVALVAAVQRLLQSGLSLQRVRRLLPTLDREAVCAPHDLLLATRKSLSVVVNAADLAELVMQDPTGVVVAGSVYSESMAANEWTPPPAPELNERQHGTRTTYTAGCRCEECRNANADYQRDYYRQRRVSVPTDS